MKRILITGAAGQIGTELVAALAGRYGPEAVLATDIRDPSEWANAAGAATDAVDAPDAPATEQLDCLDADALAEAVKRFRADTVFHLVSVLSAAAEAHPSRAYRINMDSLLNVLEVASKTDCRVFAPSSIAVFGPGASLDPARQSGALRPRTMYGVTKVAGELLCDYYRHRHGVDVRGLRFPGLISHTAAPGGGTTDYAVEIFHAAVKSGSYRCFLGADTRLDMMYMDDAIRAAIELMETDADSLSGPLAFNVTAMQFTPAELAEAIRERLPDLQVEYRPDPVRQSIADSWPDRMDDSEARRQWGWRHRLELPELVTEMLRGLGAHATPDSQSRPQPAGDCRPQPTHSRRRSAPTCAQGR